MRPTCSCHLNASLSLACNVAFHHKSGHPGQAARIGWIASACMLLLPVEWQQLSGARCLACQEEMPAVEKITPTNYKLQMRGGVVQMKRWQMIRMGKVFDAAAAAGPTHPCLAVPCPLLLCRYQSTPPSLPLSPRSLSLTHRSPLESPSPSLPLFPPQRPPCLLPCTATGYPDWQEHPR